MNPIRATLSVLALGVLSLALVACDGASAGGNGDRTETPTATTPAPDSPQEWDHPRVEELAPIESIDVLVLESFPPRYVLTITSGLPSGCAAFERTDVARDGNTFNVSVINTMPAPDADVACTMIYGYHDQRVTLEGIESGVEYTVNVNGETLTFTGQ